jgi:hypothetical protein
MTTIFAQEEEEEQMRYCAAKTVSECPNLAGGR